MAIEKVHPDKAPKLGFPGREMVYNILKLF